MYFRKWLMVFLTHGFTQQERMAGFQEFRRERFWHVHIVTDRWQILSVKPPRLLKAQILQLQYVQIVEPQIWLI